MGIILIFFIGLCHYSTLFAQEEAPLLTIPDGQLRGTTNKTVKEGVTYYAYRGIPFAKTPTGTLRFAAPVKNEPWTGILNATSDKDECTQLVSALAVGANSTIVKGSEDCLYVNVYSTNVTASLPVMVWIYGGGFTTGNSSYKSYGPDYFLESGVVFVSFNYRLGVFGYLSTEDSAASGNWGLKDQVLALKWVKQNVKHFGGDPEKITIFGQSAGSASVSYLTHTNQTKGLFRGAILESGSSLCSWTLTRNARDKAFFVGLRLGIVTLSSQNLVEQLRKIDYKKLKLAENNITTGALLTSNLLAGLPFGPVIEPDIAGAVITNKTWELLSKGQFHKVPLMIGYTSEEAGSFSGDLDSVRPVLLQYDINFVRLAPYDLTSNVISKPAAGLRVKNHFFGLSLIGNNETALVNFVSLDLFERPIREHVVLASKHTKVYYYKFSYEGLLGDPDNSSVGVGHAEEIPYLFKVGNRLPNSSRDSIVAQRLVALWTNFAKTGNPTPGTNQANSTLLGNVTWEPNTANSNANTSVKYLDINHDLSMKSNPFQSEWEFYQKLYKDYGDPPYGTY